MQTYIDINKLTEEESLELAEQILSGQFPEVGDDYEELEVVDEDGESNS